jgi:XRE family transcriptional regulator, regulator of sulfur utilization
VAKKDRAKIGEAVLKYRKKARLSQEALAEKADIHPNYVGRIERGECAATVEILIRLARCLKVHPSKLFNNL